MGRVTYTVGGIGKRLIPAPFVNISKDILTHGNSTTFGSVFTLTLTGTIVSYKGSPNSSGVFHTTSGEPADETLDSNQKLKSITAKQDAIRDLFKDTLGVLEVQSDDGSAPVRILIQKVVNIDFPEGLWVEVCPYTITCEASYITSTDEDEFPYRLRDASESWNFELGENLDKTNKSFTVSHTVTAQGYTDVVSGVNVGAYKQAKDWVLSKAGIPSGNLSSGIIPINPGYGYYNHVRSLQSNELEGTVQLTESWQVANNPWIESYSVNVTKTNSEAFDRVGIQGSVKGLEQRNDDYTVIGNAYDNAVSGWESVSGLLFTRAQDLSNLSLTNEFLSETLGYNEFGGEITYSFEYSDKPSRWLSNARSEVISITDLDEPSQEFANIGCIGLSYPILQNMNTSVVRKKTLNYEAVLKPSGTILQSLNFPVDLTELVNAAKPDFADVFQTQPQKNWVPSTGRLSYSVEWFYTE